MAGLPYIGKARLFGRDYMARYTALENSQGQVIGATFVGVDITQDMVNLRARLAKVKVGDSGHVHVLALAGPERGQWLLHPEHSGRPAAAQRDAHDQPAYAALLAGAVQRAGHAGRHEGAYFGWWNFATKLNLALAAGIALPALALLGYQSKVTTSPQALLYLAGIYALLPCVLKALAAIALATSPFFKPNGTTAGALS